MDRATSRRLSAEATPRRTSRRKPTDATHASITDPEAKLYCRGAGGEAKLAFLGHALMENRCGLVVDACLTQANGQAAAPAMIEKHADSHARSRSVPTRGGACPWA